MLTSAFDHAAPPLRRRRLYFFETRGDLDRLTISVADSSELVARNRCSSRIGYRFTLIRDLDSLHCGAAQTQYLDLFVRASAA
jgi:hypothetical protein